MPKDHRGQKKDPPNPTEPSTKLFDLMDALEASVKAAQEARASRAQIVADAKAASSEDLFMYLDRLELAIQEDTQLTWMHSILTILRVLVIDYVERQEGAARGRSETREGPTEASKGA